ncbi:MAG TPA: hypothetical protein VE291_12420 [Terracidiphilus sp.]|jgi:hypothetical protein|nr:hypothetical protein [Terracidiphilus sp.]
MNNEIPREIYRAAFAQAEQELLRIQSEFERLSLRHNHVAKVVEVLKPAIHFDGFIPVGNTSLTTRKAGLSVVTRLAVMEKLPEA